MGESTDSIIRLPRYTSVAGVSPPEPPRSADDDTDEVAPSAHGRGRAPRGAEREPEEEPRHG